MSNIVSGVLAASAGVRRLRTERRLTLDQLSATAGLSKGHLSRFERGEKTLSVAALMRLAQALGVPVSVLLGEERPSGVPHLVRREARATSSVAAREGGYQFALLSSSTGGTSPEVFLLQLRNGPTTEGTVRASHGGREGLFVVLGKVEVDVADQSFRLDTGDYLEFFGSSGHFLRSLSPMSEILVVVERRTGKSEGAGG